MNYLITGGAGFVGSYLTEKLISEGHEVDIIDNLSTGIERNLDKVSGNSLLKVHVDSIMNEELLDSLVKKADVVFHLAAAVGVRFVIDNPLKSLEVNVKGTELILRIAHKYDKQILITSTSEIYGKNEDAPFSEDHDRLLGPTTVTRWGYATSKALDEFLALAYHREKNLKLVIVRLFNTVGARQSSRYGMVLPTFVKAALNGETLYVHGDGKQSRCFGNVNDVARALIELTREPKADGEVFNVGSNEEITILELAKLIKSMTGSNSEIKLLPYDKAFSSGFEDMVRRVPDISKINRYIGYKPTYDLNQTIKQVIDHYKE